MKYNYIRKVRKGIDDLLNVYAFHGASQGDETRTNSLQEYKDSEGWLIPAFHIEGELTQKNIDKEVELRRKLNDKYIKKLKISGEYGKIIENKITIDIEDDEIFDKKQTIFSKSCESYRFEILDISKKQI